MNATAEGQKTIKFYGMRKKETARYITSLNVYWHQAGAGKIHPDHSHGWTSCNELLPEIT